MDPTRASPVPEQLRPWLAVGGLVAVPLYVLPLGVWGLRALRPRLLRDLAGGAIALGMLSLVGLGVSGLARMRAGRPGGPRPTAPTEGEHWRLPRTEPLVPDSVTASALSGH